MLLDKVFIRPYIKLYRCFVEGRKFCIDVHNVIHPIVSTQLLTVRLLSIEIPTPHNFAACPPCDVDRPLLIELINE